MNFVLSGRDLAKLAVMLVIATVAFGLSGLLMILIMQWMTLQSFAEDATDKHGIAEVKASRLGGVAVALGISLSLVFYLLFAGNREDSLIQLQNGWPIWLAAAGCFTLGLMEDLRNNSLSPRVRIASKAALMLGVFLLVPEMVPRELDIPLIDWLLTFQPVALLLVSFFSVGFINAVNTVDGANGLVSGIFVFACIIFSLEFSHITHPAALHAAMLFLIFNVISGRLFLGDAGSYGMGAAMLFSALAVLADGSVSIFFLAALYFYPCFDFLVSILRRLLAGQSVTEPDNDHFHNRLHGFFRRRFKSKNLANSVTGLSIAGASSGLVLLIYVKDLININSAQWLWVFIFQSVLYGVVFIATGVRARMYARMRELGLQE